MNQTRSTTLQSSRERRIERILRLKKSLVPGNCFGEEAPGTRSWRNSALVRQLWARPAGPAFSPLALAPRLGLGDLAISPVGPSAPGQLQCLLTARYILDTIHTC
ncbi:unnamed protein product [Rangifer tarandus platyrhynchus]|uniref:Uncharacterized protein n=1 Tax=Rangifer tarandus platyrhynchus TaxID=3082113 RepID=A0AC59ZLI2_RANTA